MTRSRIVSHTDAENTQWPDDHRDGIALVHDRIEERIETRWGEQ